MYTLYQIGISVLFILFFPLLLLIGLIGKRQRAGIIQRLGFGLSHLSKKSDAKRLWMHASSVGEVQAARALVNEIRRVDSKVEIILSTMTPHGQKVAKEQLPNDVICIMAPLDIPFLVTKTIKAVSPNIYVCLETELWPSILRSLKKRGVPVVMMNGRMSVRSLVTYNYVKGFFKQVLDNFDKMAFITKADMKRYIRLGADKENTLVAGNVKYDLPLPADCESVASSFKKLLNVSEDHEVFITGSTHTGEEEQLLPLFRKFSAKGNFVWLIAPRHLERLGNLEKMFDDEGIAFDRFTELKKGASRKNSIVLIDVMGELSHLYSIATYVFCGGSLVAKGGHNIMEAAIWDKGVFYGPSMYDYKDAVSLLESAQAGFLVKDAEQLIEKIEYFRKNPDQYATVCHRAGTIAHAQQGAAKKQVEIILQQMN